MSLEGTNWPCYHTTWSATSHPTKGTSVNLLQGSLPILSLPRKTTASQPQVFMKIRKKTGCELSIGTVFFPSPPLDSDIFNSLGVPGGSVVKDPPANAGDERDRSSIPGLGRFPGEGNGNSFQYSCLEHSMDRGAWWATVHGVTKSQIRLSTKQFTELTGSLKREGSSEPVPS